MKEKGVVLFVLLVMPLVLAGEEINISYPSSVNVGDEFNINVELIDFEEDVYDIKFEILNGSQNIAQRYWENEWKSTNYWMEGAINSTQSDKDSFRLKVVENYNGNNEIKIKVRDSSDDVEGFDSYFIDIIGISSNEDDDSNDDIYFELEWDEDNIVNKGEFKIKVKAFNLNDVEYDVRLWIEDNEKIISERYDYEEEKWKSGNYYLNNYFKGPGNKSEKIKMRIKDDYSDFIGGADLFFKIRNGVQIEEDIEVLEKKFGEIKEEELEEKVEVLDIKIERTSEPVTSQVIKLGERKKSIDSGDGEQEDLKEENYIVYESKTEKIKKYAVYFFALLCVLMGILISWRKLE